MAKSASRSGGGQSAKKVAAKKTASRRSANRKPAKAARKRSAAAVAAPVSASTEPIPLATAEAIAGVMRRPQRAAAWGARESVAVERVVPKQVADARARLQKQEDRELTQRIRDYKATMELLERRGVALSVVAPPETPERMTPVPLARANRPLRVMAEGDSWFNYPPFPVHGGLVKRLSRLLGVPILDLSKAGDEVRNMLGVEQRKLIAKHLRAGTPSGGYPWDCFLFSGGGNDIVGNPMALWIQPFVSAATPAQLINQPRFSAALAIVKSGYEDLIALRDSLSPTTELVFHSYDYAIPDGRGVCGFGPWLWPSFELHGYPSTAVAFPVVKEMLHQFADMLRQLAASHRGITFVDTQNTLSPVAMSWHNELHPSDAGYDLVAQQMMARLAVRFP